MKKGILSPEVKISDELISYDYALDFMEKRVDEIHTKGARELIWILEHESVYTAGTSAEEGDLLNPKFPVFSTGRGGKYVYHGPGQLVVYLMLNLKERKIYVKEYVKWIENIVIEILNNYSINGYLKEDYVGVWVNDKDQEKKIAALGIRVRKHISFHGFALNLNPDLEAYDGIVPCGIKEFGVTSMKEVGVRVSMEDLKQYICNYLRDI